MRIPAANRKKGLQFETLLMHRAAASGMLAIKQDLTFRYLAGGKIQPRKSELDFSLLTRCGRVAYVDAKAFGGDSFYKSALDKDQVARARMYNTWNVPAGFVVLLEGLSEVFFFTGADVAFCGERRKMRAEHGVRLGTESGFFLDRIFEAEAPAE